MSGKSLSRPPVTSTRALVASFGVLALLASGCVTYRAHVNVHPDGDLDVTEHAELLPGVADSLHVERRLAWTAFEATTESRGGKFTKASPDTNVISQAVTSRYPLDDWTEFGQRGQAFKGIDEVEHRTLPPNAQVEVKDQYFFKDTKLTYRVTLTEPSGTTVDSLAKPWLDRATGRFEIEVPGAILSSSTGGTRQGNTVSWPLKYGDQVDVEIQFRQLEWVPVVSVVLVFGFLIYLLFVGLKALRERGARAKGAA